MKYRFAGAMLVAASVMAAGGCRGDSPPGGATAEPGVTVGSELPGTATPGSRPLPGGPLVVVAAEVGGEETRERRYPVLEVVSFDAGSGEEVGRFRVGGSDDFIVPGMVFLIGREVVTVGEGRVTRWTLDGRQLATVVRWAEDQRPTTAAVSHDGRLLAVGWESATFDRERGGLLVVELATGRVVREWGMDVWGPLVGAWPAPVAWHADDGGLELFGYAHRGGPGQFASVRLDGTMEARGARVAEVEPGGRVVALAEGGWTLGCEALGLAARELRFAEPVGGEELGRARVDGFVLSPVRFSPAADAAVLMAFPLATGSEPGTECFRAGPSDLLLFSLATGKLERLQDPAAVAGSWNDRLLPAVDCPGQAGELEAAREPTRTVYCPEGAAVRIGGREVLRAPALRLLGVAR